MTRVKFVYMAGDSPGACKHLLCIMVLSSAAEWELLPPLLLVHWWSDPINVVRRPDCTDVNYIVIYIFVCVRMHWYDVIATNLTPGQIHY